LQQFKQKLLLESVGAFFFFFPMVANPWISGLCIELELLVGIENGKSMQRG
jgi:hypothetical protein